MNEDNFDFWPSKPRWECQSCDYVDKNKPMPTDRAAWYARDKLLKCPKCKSESLKPVGWY